MSTQTTTVNGRIREEWETDRSEFLKRGGILADSILGEKVYRLSGNEFEQLVGLCDPKEDSILGISSEHVTINHGNVGTRGIRYEFN